MGISRRTFVGRVAAVPLAARLAGASPAASAPRVAVVGAGAFGGWIALELLRRGARVVLLDAWGPGNLRASSGGATRVIRAVYGPDRVYVEMVRRSYELWDEIDSIAEEPLYTETGTLWMHRGSDAYVRSSAPILAELGFPLDPLPLDEARRRYPQIEFRGIESVWLERRAGALSARRACAVVRDAVVTAGGTYRTARVDPGAVVDGSMTPLRLAEGPELAADAYVFACGPWLAGLFPGILDGWIRPTRQEVHYFGTPAGSERYHPSRLPVWIDFGERIFYGLPDLHGRGFKIADDTRGEPFDPSSGERSATEPALARARKLLAERFPELANAPLLSAEVCQYENSPDGHLIVDRHPAATNAWIVGGGSGHGFKLSPALGELVARAVLEQGDIPAPFRLSKSRIESSPSTQFDAKS